MDNVLKLTCCTKKPQQPQARKEWTSENVVINFTGNASKFRSHKV